MASGAITTGAAGARVRRRVALRAAVATRVALAALLSGLTALTGCGVSAGSPHAADPTTAAVQRLLDRRASALLHRDADGFVAAADPHATGYRAEQRQVFRNLADVPLESLRYEVLRTGGFEPAAGDGHRVAAEVRLRYRLAGYDAEPVQAVQRLTLSQRNGHWYLAAEDHSPVHGSAAPEQLWDQGRVAVARGSHSLVLGVGQNARRLREIARTADRAVPTVDDAWRGRWARRVVVLVPASLKGMGELLGAPASGYRGIAAITTGEAGGASRAPAERVIVNPGAYGVLGDFGQRVVLTHETAHVATRSVTSPRTPLWLSEGFADWAGYRGTGRTARQIATELSKAVAAGRVPRELPRNEDFGFQGDANRLATAYEEGWLACRMIADQWGEARLREFYRAVGEQRQGKGAADRAMRAVLGVGVGEFTSRWRAYAGHELGSADS